MIIFSFYFMAASLPPILAADVTLTVGNGSGFPGSPNNSVILSLDNSANKVGGLQVDICDVDDYLMSNVCATTGRTSGFECMVAEQVDGCCRVLLPCKVPSCFIEEGSGPVAIIGYGVSASEPAGACRDLNLEGAVVMDENGNSIVADSLEGEFCIASESSASIPTTGEWGMIIFMTIIMGLGVVTLFRRRLE